MELSENAIDFARLILKHYDKKTPSYNGVEDKSSPLVENQKNDLRTKYSMDYKKFENLTQAEENKEDPLKANPYLAQMGCSHDRRKERELYEKPTKEKLDDAEFFKNEGNKAYKEGEFQKSSYFYQKALLQFDYTFPEKDEEEKRMNILKEICHTNLALVKYILKDCDESLIQCFQAIKLNPKNIKALYRKAIINFDRDNFEETQKLINEILALNPKETETLKLQENLKKKEIEYKHKSKKVLQKMFQN